MRIGQYLLFGHSGLIARLRPQNFFCGRTPAQRLAVAQAFYEQVRRSLRIAGVRSFTFQLGQLTEKVSGFDIYAVIRGGRVTLTHAGRAAGHGC